ncbi:MAG: type II toxin-antitoxin system RatA family toxin [Porticoccaceae bacterium]|nr:type II toxin-antitoxin system RatA family toxin [Porticoccaceae bacterium]
MLTTIQRSALVMHSAENMYLLVNDIEAYPQYLEGCCGAQVLEQGDDFMVARLDLRKGGVNYSFTTRNSLKPGEEIRLQLHSGPFKQLRGAWEFKVLTENASKVSFYLEFEANSQLVGVAATSLFASVINNIVSALSGRADALYGTK